MQNPRGVAHGVIEFIPISSGPGQGDGIKQGDACTLTFELNQPILVSIAEAGRPFGVGGQQARRLGHRIADTMIAVQRRSDIGTPRGLFQPVGVQCHGRHSASASSSSKRMVDLMNAAHERTCAPASIVPSGPVPSSGVHETRISHPALVEPAIEPKAVFWVTVTVPDARIRLDAVEISRTCHPSTCRGSENRFRRFPAAVARTPRNASWNPSQCAAHEHKAS